jgi:hypothetical protein
LQVQVRDARPSDAAAISRVDVESHRAAYRPIFGAEYMAGVQPDAYVERWERILAGNSPQPDRAARWVLVALVGDEILAYAGLMPSQDADAASSARSARSKFIRIDGGWV